MALIELRFVAEAERRVPRLEFLSALEKQMTLPSFAEAGMPYHVFGERAGALALMITPYLTGLVNSTILEIWNQ